MKRIIAAGLAAFILIGCASMPTTYTKRNILSGKRIAILPFLDYRETNNSGRLFTNLFTIYFMRHGFHVAEREKLSQLIQEKGLDISGLSERSTRDMATLLGVDYILTGSVTEYSSYASAQKVFVIFEWLQIICSVGVTARLIDTASGEVIWVGIANEQSYSYKTAAERIVETLFQTIEID